MTDINKILDVLYAFKLGLPIVVQDNYCNWWEVKKDHVFDFHYQYLIVYSDNVEEKLKELNRG